MPELPEVETIVRGLRKRVLDRTFINFWTDNPKAIKRPGSLNIFKKNILGKKIERVGRRGKNVLIYLSGEKILLIHQKMTGHLLVGEWRMAGGQWRPLKDGPLADPVNRFIHLIFWFDSGEMLALSDLRKFAKVELWEEEDFKNDENIRKIGPEPLEKSFTLKRFKKILSGTKGKIKQVLMNQGVVAGIGNIYSDEILWRARIHPLKETSGLSPMEVKNIFQEIKKVLARAIEVGGTSISDFRTVTGEKGFFAEERRVYRLEGEPCVRCRAKIKRIKLGGRSAHFCPKCQKL
ncbi:MAG: bifunctional DNA-formamidopyrimidine glycosylase/DNA-(apurinic or apyrimidinic site) lyase [bacterium]|nr:bifunctional DNA-formamidopyrimidine glycosylase/DNA-(apurinic or apyrimidinic site) lyase [bacterium]